MATKKNILSTALSTALFFNPFLLSFAQNQQSLDSEARAAFENVIKEDIDYLVGAGRLGDAKKLLSDKKKTFLYDSEIKKYIESLEGDVQSKSDSKVKNLKGKEEVQRKVQEFSKEAEGQKEAYGNMAYETKISENLTKKVESTVEDKLFKLKDACNRTTQDYTKCTSIVNTINYVQQDLKVQEAGRVKINEVYQKTPAILKDFNDDDPSKGGLKDLSKSRGYVGALSTIKSSLETVLSESNLRNEEAEGLIENWDDAIGARNNQIIKPEIEKEKEEQARAESRKEKEDFRKLYGVRDPIELELSRYSTNQSGQTPLTLTGMDFLLDASINKTSFNGPFPGLKEALYGEMRLELNKGSGEIKDIGNMRSRDVRDLEMRAGLKILGQNDRYADFQAGFFTKSEDTLIDFNSGTQNNMTRSLNGPVIGASYNAPRARVAIAHRFGNGSINQELSRNGVVLDGSSSNVKEEETRLEGDFALTDNLTLETLYRYTEQTNFDGKNLKSNFKVSADVRLPQKITDKSKYLRPLENVSFKAGYENENGKGYIANTYSVGLKFKFGNPLGSLYHRKMMKK